MKINFREAKEIITKSNIPNVDYVINPYTGCQHGCIYCYAEFMIRFTNHKGDKWGHFLDIKQFDLNRIKPHKYDGKRILLSSVTDPYLPLELKYQNTRMILEKLVDTTAEVMILTKSKFVVRDIDLFKRFEITDQEKVVQNVADNVLYTIRNLPSVENTSKKDSKKGYNFALNQIDNTDWCIEPEKDKLHSQEIDIQCYTQYHQGAHPHDEGSTVLGCGNTSNCYRCTKQPDVL